MSDTIFSALAARSGLTALCPLIDRPLTSMSTDVLEPVNLRILHKPTSVWTWTNVDSYRELALSGADRDKALSLLFATAADMDKELATYKSLLESPTVFSTIINSLYSRPGVPISVPQKYARLDEATVIMACNKAFAAARVQPTSAAARAYSVWVVEMLVNLGLCTPGETKYVTIPPRSRIANINQIKAAVIQHTLLETLSMNLVSRVNAKLTVGYAPQTLIEVAMTVMRDVAEGLLSLLLVADRFSTVMAVLNEYHTRPQDLSPELRLFEPLRTLAAHANFLVRLSSDGLTMGNLPTKSMQEIREAFMHVEAAIASCVDLKAVACEDYASHFGYQLTYEGSGIRRGTVIYSTKVTSSKMPLAIRAKGSDGATRLRPIPTEYANAPILSGAVSDTLLAPAGMDAIASIVANELALDQDLPVGADPSEYMESLAPRLLGIDVTEEDLVIIALARCQSLGFAKTSQDGDMLVTGDLIYAVPLEAGWRVETMAASPTIGFFRDAAAVVVYTCKGQTTPTKSWPVAGQQLKLLPGTDKIYRSIANEESVLRSKVSEEFSIALPIVRGGKTEVLTLTLNPLSPLTAVELAIGDASVVAIVEPAARAVVSARLAIALAYTKHPDPSIAIQARSWLVNTLIPLVISPVVADATQNALGRAFIAAKIDGRRMTNQLNEIAAQAAMGITLALLQRFGLLDSIAGGDDSNLVTEIVAAIPPASLTASASMARAAIQQATGRLTPSSL